MTCTRVFRGRGKGPYRTRRLLEGTAPKAHWSLGDLCPKNNRRQVELGPKKQQMPGQLESQKQQTSGRLGSQKQQTRGWGGIKIESRVCRIISGLACTSMNQQNHISYRWYQPKDNGLGCCHDNKTIWYLTPSASMVCGLYRTNMVDLPSTHGLPHDGFTTWLVHHTPTLRPKQGLLWTPNVPPIDI